MQYQKLSMILFKSPIRTEIHAQTFRDIITIYFKVYCKLCYVIKQRNLLLSLRNIG